MQTIRLNKVTGVPVFRQIVEQIVYMIEMGQLNDGDRLPSSRMLADNLHVNRNTVARAYGELRNRGLVSRQGRHGMVVRAADSARRRMAARESAHQVLATAVAHCIELGLPAEEIAALAYQQSLHAERTEVQLSFIECNIERAEAFSAELGEALETPVSALLLSAIEASDIQGQDLVITTFFHLSEVRRLVRELTLDDTPEVLGIVVAPHLKTLVRLAQIPKDHQIGIYYTTEDQAELLGQSLADSGLAEITLISGPDDPKLKSCDLVIVPSESPELAKELDGKVPLLEFGNVLDASSIKMVSDVLDEVRERKGDIGGVSVPVSEGPGGSPN